jgi:Zn-dependent protease with chaperone function
MCSVLYFLNKNNPARRARLLQPLLFSSIFSWSFLGASLLMCVAMVNQYEQNWSLAIRQVLGGSLILALTFSTVVSLLGRRHVFSKALERMTEGPLSGSKSVDAFIAVSSRMGLRHVSLREASLGTAFSVSLNGRAFVAISQGLTGSLSQDETEAVLAHELSHIKNGDSWARGVARMARLAFRFDPVLRLVEAAVHRERELWADRVAIEFTGKPLALASALVKASSQGRLSSASLVAGLFVGGSGGGLFSFYPNLERRVDALIELARKMELVHATA